MKLLPALFVIISTLNFPQDNAQYKFPLSNNKRLAWQEAELGAVFHYDLHVFDEVKYQQYHLQVFPGIIC
jgi:arginine utilization protein RocB